MIALVVEIAEVEAAVIFDRTKQYDIKLYVDGDQWCALLGENLQEGQAGFGKTPADALNELAHSFYPRYCKACYQTNNK